MFLSIMGMYDYDPSIFDGLDAPSYTDPDTQAVTVVNKEKLIQNICLECAELEVVYPAFDTMKLAIGVWSAAEFNTWQKLFATTMVKYNPIWNVDAHEFETYGRGYTDELSFNSTDTGAVQGFNSSTWADSNKVTYGGKDTHSGREDSGTEKTRQGNIGVTTTQKMLQEERELAEFSMINYITMSFKRRFCLMIY